MTSESDIVDLFSIGANNKEVKATNPFIHQVRFLGPQGEVVRAWANIDDGAMKEVMSSDMFKRVKHRLGTTTLSSQLLQVANGAVVRSEARWKGMIEVNGISVEAAFEVFDSGLGGNGNFYLGRHYSKHLKPFTTMKQTKLLYKGKRGAPPSSTRLI
jgi:hypothetical protein